MPDDEFQRHKDALSAQKLEKPKRLSAQFNRYLNEISLQQFHFERAESEVNILKTVTKDELLDFYKNFILRDAPVRHALSIHIVSTAEGGAAHEDNTDTDKPDRSNDLIMITDLATFKSSKELYPIVQPYICDIQPKGAKSKL